MKKLSFVFIILAAVMWGCIGIFTRVLNVAGLTPVQIAAIRSIFSAVILGVFVFFKDKGLYKISIKDLWMFAGTGILSLTFFNVCYFYAINMLDLSAASILLYTAPFFVMIMSAFVFKEKITLNKLAAIVIAFVGCILICGLTDKLNVTGIVFGVLSGLGYAMYSIFAGVALKKYNTYTISFYTFLMSSVSLLPFCQAGEVLVLLSDFGAFYWSVLLAVISSILPYIFYTQGLKHTTATKASVIAFAEPVTAALVGFIIFGEDITLPIFVGMLMVLSAIVKISSQK